jgi:signal transduction histidine kinase
LNIEQVCGPDGRPVARRLVMLCSGDARAHERELVLAQRRAERAQRRLALVTQTGTFFADAWRRRRPLQGFTDRVTGEYADGCLIDLRDRRGVWRAAASHADPRVASALQRAPVPDIPVHEVAFMGHTVELQEGMTALAAYADALACAAPSSLILVPLPGSTHDRGVLVLMMTGVRRKLGVDDVAFGRELAQQVSTHLDNVRLYRENRRAIRMRDEFLCICSHELRTPLQALMLHTQLQQRRILGSKEGTLEPGRILKVFEKIEAQHGRLARLIESMLDLALIRVGQLSLRRTQVELTQLVGQVLESLEAPLRAAGCAVTFAPHGPILGVWDATRLEQVFFNLLTNAMRYGAQHPIHVGADVDADAGRAIVWVRDHGKGIAPADQRRIFRRFERGVKTSEISGLGLGLYISRKIVEAHGGSLRVESPPGEGATFTVELPQVAVLDTPPRRRRERAVAGDLMLSPEDGGPSGGPSLIRPS